MITKDGQPLPSLDNPPSGSTRPPLAAALLDVLHLKRLYRQGWLRRGVPPEQGESVADHVFSMALLAWFAADSLYPGLDRDRVIRMVLVHELGEIYTGDIIPSDRVERAEKHRLERAAIEQVVGALPRAAEYLALWEEFEAGETPEARFVKQIDRLEMALQAAAYRHQGYGRMDEFFATADAAVVDEGLREILEALD